MKFKLLLTLLLIPINVSSASEILVQSKNALDIEFLSFLATHKKFKSLSESNELRLTSPAAERTILRQFESAQRAFLSANIPRAINEFKNIIAKRHMKQWSSSIRRVIIFSYFRISQLSQNPSEKKQLLKEAATYDKNAQIKMGSFPPPLMSKWEEIKLNQRYILWRPESWIKNYTSIFINGKKHPIHSGVSIRVPAGKVLISLLSNKLPVKTVILSGRKLPYINFKPSFLASGTCSSHNIGAPLKSIYFHDDCVIEPQKNANLRSANQSLSEQMIKPTTATKASGSAWYKNRWVWGGIIATSYAIYYNNYERKTVLRPTHRPGGKVP